MADDTDKRQVPQDGADDPDNRISLERQAADREHAGKIAGDIPERRRPDEAAAPRMRRPAARAGHVKDVGSTGHEWDGITEYDNPMPRWWLWTFYATIVWGVGYMVAYPAVPLVDHATKGLLGTDYRQEVAAEIARFDEANAPIQARLAEIDLAAIANDPDLMNYATNAGAALYRTWCAQCHGAGAGGSRGYPNLLDNDWLWGGTLEDIHLTLKHGIRDPQDPDTRYSEMPRFGTDGILTRAQIDQVVHHVLALSDQPHDAARAAEGATLYADNCSACHMEDGTGDRSQGAPNLADAVSLYGNDHATLTRIVAEGPHGVMPGWTTRLSEAEIRAVTTYVHGLGGGE